MKPHTDTNTSPEGINSGEIVWNGPEIKCLDICTGMKINKVIFLLASKLCEVLKPTDLSTLDLKCALEVLGKQETTPRSLQTVLQLLLDNDCHIKTLIDSINQKLNANNKTELTLNLKCLQQFDSLGNPIPYTQTSVLQSLINEVCNIKLDNEKITTLLANLGNEVADIKRDITNNSIGRKITTCLATNKDIFEQLTILSKSYCDYVQVVGQTATIQEGISKMSDKVVRNFTNATGFITSPTSLAAQFGNALIVINSLYEDLENIKKNCCKIDCNNIKIEFAVEVDSAGTSVNIIFKNKGTVIPTGFVSVGSILTLSDQFGNSNEYPIDITGPGIVGPFELLGLDRSKPLTANISVKMNNGSLFCDKCLNKTFNGLGSTCCTITNTSAEAVTVIYSTLNANNVTVINSQYLAPGAVFTLPPASKVIATSGVVSSTCADLPVPEPLNCYSFQWLYAGSGNQREDPFEGVTIVEATLNGVTYPINATGVDQDEPGLVTLRNEFSKIPGLSNISWSSTGGDNVAVALYFKTIPSIASKLELKIQASPASRAMVAYIRPIEDTRCI